MKIVFISDYTIAEAYIIEKIQEIYPDTAVIVPARILNGERPVSVYKRRPFLRHFVNAVIWKIRRMNWARKFYPDENYPEIVNQIPVTWNKLNSSEGVGAIKSISPDILITLSAPIVSNDIIQIPKNAAINIHIGIAPEYRGNDTIFWPLYYRDYSNIGGTIHLLSEGVDRGNILAQVKPDLHPFDGEIRLEHKTICQLRNVLVDLLQKAEAGEADFTGHPQNGSGRNFKYADRSMKKNISYFGERMVGLCRPPRKQGEIQSWY